MRLPQQVPRLAIVFAVAIVALIAARALLVPATFGEYGHYRAAAVDSIAVRAVRFAGRQDCEECHDDIAAERVEGYHRTLSCEVCHGPQQTHAADPINVTPEPAEAERGFCPVCHGFDPSRPTGFPQIDVVAHHPRRACVECHDAHAPLPPEAPGECSACHRTIERQKARSHHVDLPCTTCHETPTGHKVTPLVVHSGEPAERTFCAQCHRSATPTLPGAPQIDLDAHFPRYLCWQCHYPHYPET